jgi:hypothetical protein
MLTDRLRQTNECEESGSTIDEHRPVTRATPTWLPSTAGEPSLAIGSFTLLAACEQKTFEVLPPIPVEQLEVLGVQTDRACIFMTARAKACWC